MRALVMMVMTVAIVVAACGGGGATDADAPPIPSGDAPAVYDAPRLDGSVVDGSLADAASGVVTLRLPSLGMGVPVAFQTAQGEIITVDFTDANGDATATVAPGSMLTFRNSSDELVTITGLVPGDVIVRRPVFAPTFIGSMSVTIPTHVNGSASAYVRPGCPLSFSYSGGTLTQSLILDDRCVVMGNVDLFAVDVGPLTFDVRAWSSALDRIWVDGGALSMSAWSNAWTNIPVTVSGGEPSSIQLHASTLAVHDSRAFSVESFDVTPSAGGGAFTMRAPDGFAQGVAYGVELFGAAGSQTYGRRIGGTIPASIDITGAQFLPLPAGIAITPDPSDADRFTVAWTGTPAGVDAVEVLTQYNTGTQPFLWAALLAPGTQSFRHPDLPPELAANAPQSTSVFNTAYVGFHRSDYADFDSMRRVAPLPPDADHEGSYSQAWGN